MKMPMEILKHYKRNGDRLYLCAYDLEKAFDSVEYSILLHHIFQAGVNGKCWCLLYSWYSAPTCAVKVNNSLSQSFVLERGVRQGSVLSPILFSLVIDPLIERMSSVGLGVGFAGLKLGTMAHADDIRTISNSIDDLCHLSTNVKSYTTENALTFNCEKCELLITTRGDNSTVSQSVPFPIVSSLKTLGTWITSDLSSKVSVSENIKKCHRAFFAYGKLGILQGKPSPLTSRQIIEHCVIPVLLYGSENWTLNASLIDTIESCQAQLGKRILRLPKNTANVVPRLALHWPAVQTRILIRKFCFLHKCVESVAISGEVLRSMVSSGSTPSLIEQCRFLELPLGTNYTEKIVSCTASEPTPSNKEIKKKLLKKTSLIAEVLPWSMHLYVISIT